MSNKYEVLLDVEALEVLSGRPEDGRESYSLEEIMKDDFDTFSDHAEWAVFPGMVLDVYKLSDVITSDGERSWKEVRRTKVVLMDLAIPDLQVIGAEVERLINDALDSQDSTVKIIVSAQGWGTGVAEDGPPVLTYKLSYTDYTGEETDDLLNI